MVHSSRPAALPNGGRERPKPQHDGAASGPNPSTMGPRAAPNPSAPAADPRPLLCPSSEAVIGYRR